MKLSVLALGLCLSVMFGGCASLTVDVKVLDNEKLDPIAVLTDALHRKQARVDKLQADAQAAAKQIAEAGVQQMAKDNPSLVSAQDRTAIVLAIETHFTQAIAKASNHYRNARAELHKVEMEVPDPMRKNAQVLDKLSAVKDEYLRGDADLTGATQSYLDDVRKLPGVDAKNVDEHLDRLRQVLDDAVVAHAGDFSDILREARLAAIVGAPDEAWSSIVNKVYGGGCFGNVDVAVINENPPSSNKPRNKPVPEFSLKGVRLDSGSVTRAAFQGIKELVRVAAASAGIPLPESGSGAAAPTEPEGPTPKKREQTASTKRKYVRQSLLQFFDSVSLHGSTASDPKTTDEQRGKAIDAIKDAINVLSQAVASDT